MKKETQQQEERLSTVLVDSIVVASKEQVSADLSGESIILNLKNGIYYGLDAIGARIWALIQEPMSVSEIREILLKEYEVGSDRCEQEILALLESMVAQELIIIQK